jgi:hypothetical protein
MQVGQCGSQMVSKFLEAVCDKHGIGGSGEYCGDSDAHLGRINVLYHVNSGGKSVPHAKLFELELGMIGALTLSRPSANSTAQKTS